MSMSQYFAHKRIWITGASSGIGRAVAIALARHDARLALSGRNISALQAIQQQFPQTNIQLFPFDITERQAHFETVRAIEAALGGLDIAFLNAGASHHMAVKHFDSHIVEKLMQVNYFSLAYGIEAALPLLRLSPTPQLVGMSSIAAYAGLPEGAAYSAAKAAARNLLQGLRIELLAEGIAVSIVCPGFVQTPMTAKNNFPMPWLLNPEQAAEKIIQGIAAKREEIHFPKPLSLGFKLVSSLPSFIYTRLLYYIYQRKQV